VKIANNAALSHGSQKINSVSLVVGESAGIIPESVQLYFDMIAEGSPAEGAKLNVRFVKTQMHCPVCGKNFTRPRFSFECPNCGTLGNPTETGKEFYVESVELEV
jgi:hydrogenase nickel incorporation protein HypA/HybF